MIAVDQGRAPIGERTRRYTEVLREHRAALDPQQVKEFDHSQDIVLNQDAAKRLSLRKDLVAGFVRQILGIKTDDAVLHHGL